MSDIAAHLDNARTIIKNCIQNLTLPTSPPGGSELTFSLAEDDDRGENDGLKVEAPIFSTGDSLYSDEWGNENAHAGVDVLGYEIEANAVAEIGKDEIEIGAEAEASVYVARGEAGVGAGPLNAEVSAQVGASASAGAGVEVDISEGTAQVEAGGEAFVGGEIRGAAGGHLGPVEAEVGVEGKAGLGLEAEADFSIEDGKVNIDVDMGIAVGLGVGIDSSVSLDVGGTIDAVGDAGAWVADKAGDAGGWAADKLSDAGDAITFWN